MTNATRKWVRAGIEVLIHGGTAALISGITMAIKDPPHYAMFSRDWWSLVEIMFAGNGGVRLLQWWQNNPLPPDGSDNVNKSGQSIVPSPVISLNPLAKVVTLSAAPDAPKP